MDSSGSVTTEFFPGSLPGLGRRRLSNGERPYAAAGNFYSARRYVMLILSRKVDEEIVIGDNVRIMIVAISGGKVRLGIEAPKEIQVNRSEWKPRVKDITPSTEMD